MVYTPVTVVLLTIGVALCAPEQMQSNPDPHEPPPIAQEAQNAHFAPLAKRSPHYDFGLGKRAYSYVSEYKRLPVYNFGLGKRSRPYSFGLGKRSADDYQEMDDMSNESDQVLAELFDQYDDAGIAEKRARPYSFGLGKRLTDNEASEDKRAKMYDFGLGKRLPMYNFGLGKRAKSYDFGLGKRLSSKFNFGLGKRQRDMHRFNFGLGKRSADDTVAEDSDNYFED